MITIIGNQIMYMHRNLQLVDRTQLSNYVWLCLELACECLTLLSARLRVLAGQIYRILLIRRATRIAFTLNIRLITDIIVFLGTTRSCSAIIGDQRRFLLFHQSNAIALVPWYQALWNIFGRSLPDVQQSQWRDIYNLEIYVLLKIAEFW